MLITLNIQTFIAEKKRKKKKKKKTNDTLSFISSGGSISHSYVVQTSESGVLHLSQSSAGVNYASTLGGASQQSISTELQDMQVLYSSEAERRAKPHLREWAVFSGLSLASIFLPLLAWIQYRAAIKSTAK
jgi:Translocon-associated protein beta (TRAPB)